MATRLPAGALRPAAPGVGTIRRSTLLTMSGLAIALTCTGAQAQQVPAGSVAASDIIVTAQRRAERLEDVPMSITALSTEQLDRSGISNTGDLARVTPGLTMGFYGNNLQPAIRGVSGTGATIGDASAVPIYLDGIYQPHQLASVLDLPDVQQIEVLKGPQGTLYGQNATGGAIIINTMAPSFTPTGRIRASYGNYDNLNLRGFVTGPINDVFAVSLAGAYENRKGFRHQVLTGERDQGLESRLVRGKLLFQPSSAAAITLTGYYARRRDASRQSVSALHNNSLAYRSIPTAPKVTSAKQFGGDPAAFQQNRSYGFSAKGDFTFDAGTLSVIAAYTHNKVASYADVDASPIDYAINDSPNRVGRYAQGEANFASRKFGDFSFTAGLFYMKGRDGFYPTAFRLYSPTLPPAPRGALLFTSPNHSYKQDEIIAGYAELSYQPTDQLTLTAGGRYTHHEQRGFAVASFTAPLVPYPGNPVKWNKFSPRLTARYEVAQNQNIYATFAQGFKGGQINTGSFAQPATDPEIITSYEIGYKGRLAPGTTLNVSLFRYDYKDLQVVAYLAPIYITQNAASARGKGVDIDGSWQVTPEFALTGGIEYLDARYRKFPNAQGFVPNTDGYGNRAVTADFSGRRLLRSPKWSGNVGANYQLETATGRLGAFASVYFSSRVGLDPGNVVTQPAFATVDGELSFAPASVPGLRLALWGKNLFDKDYLASASVSTQSNSVTYSDPRTYGIRAEFSF